MACKSDLDALDTEYKNVLDEIALDLAAAEENLKQEVLFTGQSIKGEWQHAIFIKGRESWDGKALSGFSAAHPEILAFRKVGEPSVSIRLSK